LGSVATSSYSIAHIIVVALIELFGIEVACPKLARPCYLSRFIKTFFMLKTSSKEHLGLLLHRKASVQTLFCNSRGKEVLGAIKVCGKTMWILLRIRPRFALLAQLGCRNSSAIANKSHKTATIRKSQCQKSKGTRKYLFFRKFLRPGTADCYAEDE